MRSLIPKENGLVLAPSIFAIVSFVVSLRSAPPTVERNRHIRDSHRQIMALGSRSQALEPLKVVPLRSESASTPQLAFPHVRATPLNLRTTT